MRPLGLLLGAGCCLLVTPATAAPRDGSKWQLGPTATAKGQFSWFIGQNHGTRAPADSQGDMSKKFMVVATNRNISMYDMKGNPVAPSIQQGGFDGFFIKNCQTPGSQCILDGWETSDPLAIGGDARVLYDWGTKRWYLTAFAVLRNASSPNGFMKGNILVAVSLTDDPTKSWRVLEVPSYPYQPNRWWGDFPMLGFSEDKIVISMNYFSLEPYPPDTSDQGIFILDKQKVVKEGTWSYQYIAPPPSAPIQFLQNQTGFAANPAVDIHNKRKDAYLVSSTDSDPVAALVVTTLRGLPPNVQYSIQAVNVPGWEWSVDIPQPPNLLPNVAGDGRVASAPVLRVTRTKTGGSQLRLYAARTISRNNATNGVRVDILTVDKTGGIGRDAAAVAPVALEGSFQIFSGTDKQLTYPSIAVNKAGWIGLGHSVGDGFGMGAGLFSVNPVTGAVTCVPPFPGIAMNHSRWGDYSSTRNNPYCEGGRKGAGFCAFQMRGAGGEKQWDVMAGCYCEKALAAACTYQPTLTVVGGSFAGYKNVPFAVQPLPPYPDN